MKLHEALAKRKKGQGIKIPSWNVYIFKGQGQFISIGDLERDNWELEPLPPKQVTITRDQFNRAWAQVMSPSPDWNQDRNNLIDALGLSDE